MIVLIVSYMSVVLFWNIKVLVIFEIECWNILKIKILILFSKEIKYIKILWVLF